MSGHLGTLANAFHPADTDWVVSIVYADGTQRNRRINPGTIKEEQAVAFALAADKRAMSDAVSIACRRASDRSIQLSGVDSFLERMRRMRG